jgi:hypothetical protein
MRTLHAILAVLAVCLTGLPAHAQTIPGELITWWRQNAPTCEAPDGFKFPGKMGSGGECDDGDMTLFAGLLCASGEQIGCETVRRSQLDSGQWNRSPRRAQTNNLGNPNSFSPDMALGAQLYLATEGDSAAGSRWLEWMDRVRPCIVGSGDLCLQSPLLRFCTDDNESGCTVRPGDASMLDATSRNVGFPPPTKEMRAIFHQAGLNTLDMLWLSAQVNKPGYSQHLVAVQIMLLRKMKYTDERLRTAALRLKDSQPANPFFAWLYEGRTIRVRDLTLAQCPSPATGVAKDRTQWAWEREDAEKAWKNSMVWDCIFMARLLENG